MRRGPAVLPRRSGSSGSQPLDLISIESIQEIGREMHALVLIGHVQGTFSHGHLPPMASALRVGMGHLVAGRRWRRLAHRIRRPLFDR